jgi:hypothetical protein
LLVASSLARSAIGTEHISQRANCIYRAYGSHFHPHSNQLKSVVTKRFEPTALNSNAHGEEHWQKLGDQGIKVCGTQTLMGETEAKKRALLAALFFVSFNK